MEMGALRVADERHGTAGKCLRGCPIEDHLLREETFTGSEGKYVELKETIRGFKMLIEGKCDDIPEQAFYMKGTIDEVLDAAQKMKAAA